MPKDLDGRVTRLERGLGLGRGGQQLEQWRAQIGERFADLKYDAHRDAIIEALCSPDPKQRTYRMELPTVLYSYPATELHYITAGDGGPIVHILIMPDKEDDPNLGDEE